MSAVASDRPAIVQAGGNGHTFIRLVLLAVASFAWRPPNHLVWMAALFPAAHVGAAVFAVSHTLDSGPGSLRQAISDANATGGADTITCANVTGTIALASALPALTGETTIVGPGADRLTVSGGNLFRVFEIAAGSTVTMTGVTMADGRATNGGGEYSMRGT